MSGSGGLQGLLHCQVESRYIQIEFTAPDPSKQGYLMKRKGRVLIGTNSIAVVA